MRKNLIWYQLILIIALIFGIASNAYGYSYISLLGEKEIYRQESVNLLPFEDVSGHWGEPFIAEMYVRDLMTGYDDNLFRPDKPVTKLEALVLIVKSLGFDPESDEYKLENKYLLKDIFKVPDWALPYADFAIKNDMLFFREIENMSYHQPLIRQDAAVLIVRALGLSKSASKDEMELSFVDVDKIRPDAKGYVAIASAKGIINGSPSGAFLPTNPISRAEFATMLSKAITFMDIQKDITEMKGNFVSFAEDNKNLINIEVPVQEEEQVKMKEQQVQLPKNILVYKNNNRTNLEQIQPGDHLTIIVQESDEMALVKIDPRIIENTLNFEKINLQSEDSSLSYLIEQTKLNKGYYAFKNDSDIYLLICRGEKPTSGYNIEINNVTYSEEDAAITVTYKKSDPIAGKVYLPYINYPYYLVKITPASIPSKIIYKDEITEEINESQIENLK